MILKSIYLYPDLTAYPPDMTAKFKERSRSLCNFIGRHLTAKKVTTDGYKRVCFIGKDHKNTKSVINNTKVLTIGVFFDKERYSKIEDNNELQEFFIAMIIDGLAAYDKSFLLPETQIFEAITIFRDTGYVNNWIFKSRAIKHLTLKAKLECSLTLSAFHLKLLVLKKNDVIHEEVILTTPPDDIVFTPMLKDISIEGDILTVLNKQQQSIYELDLTTLTF